MGAPYSNETTSKEAAASIEDLRAQLLRSVYHAILNSGPIGRTCDEIEADLQLSHQTASARVNDLMKRGFIEDSTRKRKTRSHRNAIVWVAKVTPTRNLDFIP